MRHLTEGNHSDSSLSAWDPDKGGDGHIINYLNGTNGMVYGALLSSASVTGNTVNAFGGYSPTEDNVEDNAVNIFGGTVNSYVTGAYSLDGDAYGNTVNIYAVDDITGGIYGSLTSNGSSYNNTVNILGTINISGYLDAYGTQTINIASKNNHVSTMNGTDGGALNMNFFLPSDTQAGDTMLTIDNSGTGINLEGTTFGVAAQSGLSLDLGDKVTLIYDANGITTDSTISTTTSLTVLTGISTDTAYGFSIEKNGDTAITTTVTSKAYNHLRERTKSLVETRV